MKTKEIFGIFLIFTKIGIFAFGGGYAILPLLHKDISDARGWATQTEVSDYFATSQFMPGIIAVNIAMMIGYKRKGVPGMIAAALGIIFPAVTVMLIIAEFLQNFMRHEAVANALNGIYIAVLVLILNAVVRMLKNGVKDIFGVIIFIISLVVFIVFNVSPVFAIIAGAVCGVIIKNIRKETRR